MPYIKMDDRKKYDEYLDKIDKIETKGSLEYCIFKLLKKFMNDKENNYSNLHDCVYGCVHAGEEFRRRFLDLREDYAKFINGDIV
jgi:hypothetical protein